MQPNGKLKGILSPNLELCKSEELRSGASMDNSQNIFAVVPLLSG